ncbi:MAG: SSU ribosomal protein S15Ae (S8p) [Candidatus Fermentimicrarchaeum limneticum]|uniref:Small ribosomal subunit protein uS8 n=1 Tax=Fermentimicrarchaeum limneticum TaxID=2795018 RepID=A0A7D5XPX6_FERL1|nr:MAG: SSU ribosomal protein S15Ae (S8p) [Candidatus Fermentimicrarchaeum limneticum]
MTNDPLADAVNTIKTHEMLGRSSCVITPASKLIKEVLMIFQQHKYIGEFEYVDDGKSGSFKVQLNGNINDCKVIKPRFAVKKDEWAKWEQRYVPGPDFGILVVSTPQGLMTNADARGKKIGGRLVAYIY